VIDFEPQISQFRHSWFAGSPELQGLTGTCVTKIGGLLHPGWVDWRGMGQHGKADEDPAADLL
ncbi:MAG: hypothetical protein KK482_25875, partial [Sinorhizobium meliloti]|nr:hypothetical protein [Sinorhizobium meliloti]